MGYNVVSFRYSSPMVANSNQENHRAIHSRLKARLGGSDAAQVDMELFFQEKEFPLETGMECFRWSSYQICAHKCSLFLDVHFLLTSNVDMSQKTKSIL